MSNKTKVDIVRDFLAIANRVTNPGFARALGLDPYTLLHSTAGESHNSIENLSHDSQTDTFSFLYNIPHHACPKKRRLPLSGFLAVLDDVTSWAIVAEDRKRRGGLSTWLFAELGPAGHRGLGMNAGDTVQINATVVKVGNIFGFARADAIDLNTGGLICTGRHTKYLPMTFAQELMLGPLLPITMKYVTTFPKKQEEPPTIITTMDDLLQEKNGNFRVEKNHTNPLGSCHGGCQAMMMELMANNYSPTIHRGSEKSILHSISVSYMSTGTKEIDFSVSNVNSVGDDTLVSMSIKATTGGGGRKGNSLPISEGILNFTTTTARK